MESIHRDQGPRSFCLPGVETESGVAFNYDLRSCRREALRVVKEVFVGVILHPDAQEVRLV